MEKNDWIRKRFDVVVIGAGIGGLCAGAILAKKGKTVLVVEKCDRVGGRGRTMPHDGYVLANAFRSQTVEYVNKAKAMCGAEFKLRKVPTPVLNFYNVEEKKFFPMPEDMAKEGVQWLMNLGITEPDEIKSFMTIVHGMLSIDPQQVEIFNRDHTSFKAYIQKQTDNVKIQKAVFDLSTYSSHGIFNWEKFAAGDFFKKIMPAMAGGNIAIFNGDPTDQAIVDGFAKVITDNGGQIRLNTEARQIIVKEEQVRGVLIQDNYFDTWLMAETEHVVSNLPVWQNLSILDNDLLPAQWKKHIKEYQTFQGLGVGIWYGLKKKVTDMSAYIRLLSSNPEIGTQGKYQGGAFFLSNTSPGHAQDGKQLFFIERFFGDEYVEDWDALEQAVANFRKWTPELFDVLKKEGMCTDSFEDVVEMEKVGVHRPSWGVVQWTVLPKPKIQAPGIDGLYFVGDTVKAGAWGYDLAAASGIDAAEMILG